MSGLKRRAAAVALLGLLVVGAVDSSGAGSAVAATQTTTHSGKSHAGGLTGSQWKAKYGGTITSLQKDITNVNAGTKAGDATKVLNGCQQMRVDVKTLQGAPPVPAGQRAQQLWSAGL